MTCLGIFGKFLYLVQEFRLTSDTLKNGTSRVALYGSAPPRRAVLYWEQKDICGTVFSFKQIIHENALLLHLAYKLVRTAFKGQFPVTPFVRH